MRHLDLLTSTKATFLGILLALLLFPVATEAAEPPLFTQIPESLESGEGAGQLENPQSVASDPATGHIYVADRRNQRVDEFTAWGEFVKAWGWGVDTGAEELQICTAASGCEAGLPGAGPGQLKLPQGGLAVDSKGDIYVADMANLRVEKFDSDGSFLLMFGGGVNKTTNADVCTQEDLEKGDECGAGTSGTGNAEFTTSEFGDYIEYSPATESIWVGDVNRIQEFGLDGAYQSQLPLPLEKAAASLAVDRQSGAVYVTLRQPISDETSDAPFVYKHTVSGWEQFAEVGDSGASPFPVRGFPHAVATDSEGNVYVTAEEKQTAKQSWEQVLKFDSSGNCVLCQSDEFAKAETTLKGDPFLISIATGFGCKVASADIYIARFRGEESFIDIYGPHPDPSECPPLLFHLQSSISTPCRRGRNPPWYVRRSTPASGAMRPSTWNTAPKNARKAAAKRRHCHPGAPWGEGRWAFRSPPKQFPSLASLPGRPITIASLRPAAAGGRRLVKNERSRPFPSRSPPS